MKATFDGYEIDSSGFVISPRTGVPMKTRIVNGGYHAIGLCVLRKRKNFLLHRLIALVFIPNPDKKPHINHKDGDKDNNSFSNLEWCTPKENAHHAYATGLRHGRKLGDHHLARLVLNLSTGIYYDTLVEAVAALGIKKTNGIRSTMIRQNGFAKKHKLLYV